MTRHSARGELAAQLDVLMGVTRDGTPGDGPSNFYDPVVCKFHLVGLCPHDLFTNTKVDMGQCSDVHMDGLKAKYEEYGKTYDFGYEVVLLRYLERMLLDLQTKIERESARLADDESEEQRDEKRQLMAERQVQVSRMLADVEVLAEEGKVEESMVLMKQAEELKAQPIITEKEQRIREELAAVRVNRPNFVADQRNQQLRCCDVCGALLSIFETDRCLADHFGGKQHLGYLAIRQKIKELKEQLKDDSRTRVWPGQEARVLEGGEGSATKEGHSGRDSERDRDPARSDDRRDDRRDRDDRRRDARYDPYSRRSGDRDRDRDRRYRQDDRRGEERYRRRDRDYDDRYDSRSRMRERDR